MARHKALKSVSIRSLQSSTALIMRNDGSAHMVDSRLLQYGDIFRVIPHARVVTDGIIIRGESEIDESMLTGESRPVEKPLGSEIIAGSTNGSGTIDVLVTRLPPENTISTIAKLVDEAAFSKPPIQNVANKVASYFVPFMIVLTIVVFVVQLLHRVLEKHEGKSKASIDALQYAIAVLIVSCPCAIALAVPMVVVIAGGVAASHGVVLKDPIVLEVASKTSHVIFDKTGTLTLGEMEVEKAFTHSRKAQSIVLGLTADLNHPVAKAIYKHLQDNSTQEQVENVTVLVSKGIEGNYEGKVVRGGNCRWLGVESNPQVQEILTAGNTLFAVTMDDQVIAVFGLHSPVRSEAARVIRELQKRGITISIVSGDEKGAVESVAESMNVPLQNVRSRCSPSDKQNYIREALGPNCGNIVIFCGDGTNDAVALKQATIGVHMEGTDVAKSAANVVLVRPDLKGILNVLDISKAAYRRIWFNFAWSFIYNMLAVTMAAGAWEKLGVEIKPQYAALGELVSVLPVIAIAVQLRFVRFEDKAKIKKKEGEGGTGKDV